MSFIWFFLVLEWILETCQWRSANGSAVKTFKWRESETLQSRCGYSLHVLNVAGKFPSPHLLPVVASLSPDLWYLQCQRLYLVNEGCRVTTSNYGWIYRSSRAEGFGENVNLGLLPTVFWYVKPKHCNITDIDFFRINLFSNILLAYFARWEAMWPNKSLPMTHYMYRIHIKKELTGDKINDIHSYYI